MKKYRSLPIEIEAIQYNGKYIPDCLALDSRISLVDIEDHKTPCEKAAELLREEFLQKNSGGGGAYIRMRDALITTPEGRMTIHPYDWIIRGLGGELYGCKDSIFTKKYGELE